MQLHHIYGVPSFQYPHILQSQLIGALQRSQGVPLNQRTARRPISHNILTDSAGGLEQCIVVGKKTDVC